MAKIEDNQRKRVSIQRASIFDTASFIVALASLVVLLSGIREVSMSLLVIGTIGLTIGLTGGIIFMVFRLARWFYR